ncbi:LOW QUALITY PROTEIN: Amino acid transporter [Geosmithia morbida]|uniref:Amino acid transporter n=1 Tax=Geosmithia morbida TaxID=1094350 RepID=A0A9P4Z1S9_9HYPO|nr:LOW QUALITY PROTEIN: Amino acid transporter [Geosmithia morbida]KAF4126100.1 LOW QUALITY PROTEIN: Amino acid transporter [Geosmithia morbida]
MGAETKDAAEGHLQQRMSRLTMVAMTFAILNTWIGLAGSIGLVLPSGGSTCLLYGFIFCIMCNFALGASLGEMAAIWPTAGGQYHFVYALCSDRYRRVLSFWVGWVNIVGWLTLVTASCFFAFLPFFSFESVVVASITSVADALEAKFVVAAASIASDGAFTIHAWETYLIYLAILMFGMCLNIWGYSILGRWNNCALYWSIVSAVVVGVVLLSTSEKTDARYVFSGFENETGWPDGMSWMLGLLQPALSLGGFDACLHMTEEMPRASVDAPRAILYAVAVGGITGIAFIIIILFCLVDPASILSTQTDMPITELLYQATGSRVASAVLSLVFAVCFVNGTVGCLTSSSRLIWSMARDGGILPSFSHLSPTFNVPVRALGLCFVFNVCFGLLYLGPTVAFSAYSASCTIFLNVSYVFPVIVVLVRGRHLIEQNQVDPGLLRLGRYGYLLNTVAAVYVVFTSVLFCFPTTVPVSGNSMNFVTAVVGIFVICCSAFWLVYGKQFQGPEFNAIIGHEPGVLEGAPDADDAEMADLAKADTKK